MQRTKKLRVFAGPNGSGKSTLYNETKNYFKQSPFINADEIELLLSRKGLIDLTSLGLSITQMDLINFSKTKGAKTLIEKAIEHDHLIDIEIKNNFIVDKSKNTHSYEASYTASFIRNLFYRRQLSFSFETVMSHNSKLLELKKAKENGYKIYLYFVCTDNPEINIQRVANRVDKGGHNVIQSKIKSRYNDTLGNLYNAIQLSDRAFLFDNSGKKFQFIAEISNGDSLKLLVDKYPKWLNDYVLVNYYYKN